MNYADTLRQKARDLRSQAEGLEYAAAFAEATTVDPDSSINQLPTPKKTNTPKPLTRTTTTKTKRSNGWENMRPIDRKRRINKLLISRGLAPKYKNV